MQVVVINCYVRYFVRADEKVDGGIFWAFGAVVGGRKRRAEQRWRRKENLWGNG
jgi:hypothetical protein